MKRILPLFLILGCFASTAFGQFTIVDASNDTTFGPQNKLDLPVYSKFNSTVAEDYVWERVENSVPQGWATAICDKYSCYDTSVNSAEFDTDADETFDMIVHFYPDNNCGIGQVVLKVYPKGNEAGAVFREYNARVWCTATASVKTITVKKNTLEVSPNPASNQITVTFGGTPNKTVDIYDLVGNKVASFATNSLQSTFDISQMKKGVYFVSVTGDDGQRISKRFVKQ
jgi:hypothetical protein